MRCSQLVRSGPSTGEWCKSCFNSWLHDHNDANALNLATNIEMVWIERWSPADRCTFFPIIRWWMSEWTSDNEHLRTVNITTTHQKRYQRISVKRRTHDLHLLLLVSHTAWPQHGLEHKQRIANTSVLKQSNNKPHKSGGRRRVKWRRQKPELTLVVISKRIWKTIWIKLIRIAEVTKFDGTVVKKQGRTELTNLVPMESFMQYFAKRGWTA